MDLYSKSFRVTFEVASNLKYLRRQCTRGECTAYALRRQPMQTPKMKSHLNSSFEALPCLLSIAKALKIISKNDQKCYKKH